MTRTRVHALIRVLMLENGLAAAAASHARTLAETPVLAWRPPPLKVHPNSRTLEGKLQFPLTPGQVVRGFALDVDGHLRGAVLVAKAQAKQVLEDSPASARSRPPADDARPQLRAACLSAARRQDEDRRADHPRSCKGSTAGSARLRTRSRSRVRSAGGERVVSAS
jgi:hypothetical protein